MDRGDLELVTTVRHRGSLVAAAASLGVAPSVVTKRLAALEARLGQRLFERTTRRLNLTPEGEAVCMHAEKLLEGFAALEAELSERQSALRGRLRIAATLGFGRRWVGPAMAEFQQRHPALQIELQLSEQLPDLGADGYDGALWLWSVQGARTSRWTSRRLARNQRILVASPRYLALRGTPRALDELANHACLTVRENAEAHAAGPEHWALKHDKESALARVRIEGPLSSNSGELVRDWCLAGHGIMLRSLWDIAPQLANGELVRVLPSYAMPDADIHWIAPWRPKTPRRVRLLVDFLAERFRGEPWKP
ncbi:LysR family transcriptional regulator [Variovorax guangxiensis]|uniref:LysR family transcriptional regulator n=1 Tax=Variovorax guangxiensis TaxID=1775474 RepID=A0A502DQW8_9BURK|nr:LysR family transcriptional regulator [Variovorax guangxiensis]TPG23268.1 LysR family transcriptional regulator [Variovorax ginsengisoli]TPG27815.1 LysR family transcriptional regulator [Variovorax guangxiensis]